MVPGFSSHPCYYSSLQRDATGGSSRDYFMNLGRDPPHLIPGFPPALPQYVL